MNVAVRDALWQLRFRYAAPLQRQLVGFWAWWTHQLADLLPDRVRSVIAERSQKLFLETDGEQLLLSLGTEEAQQVIRRVLLRATEPGSEDLPREVQQTILLMPGDKVLVKRLCLPLAAEENLREVLGFEMDLHTPFAAADVYYDFAIIARDTRKQELTLDLVYSPKREVDALLRGISALDLHAEVVTCRRMGSDKLQPVNLLPPERRRARRVDVRRLNLALSALLIVLLAAAVTIPIVQKSRAITAVEERIQAAALVANEGARLRQDLQKMADASRFLVEKKDAEIMAVQLIDEVSRILPDHTWVARLDLSDSQLELQGQSTASASLIAIIEASTYFENVAFRSPVVQVAGTEADRFHLSAEVVED